VKRSALLVPSDKPQLTNFNAKRPLGGYGGTVLSATLLVEEMYKHDRSLSLTIFGTGLGLTPLLLGGTPEQHKEFLEPFLNGEGEPLASLVHSEPGGTANYLEKGGKGLGCVARKEGGEWVVDGEKVCEILFLWKDFGWIR
jgi:alkylation response protein AidB-like acyl-CoA dehydrogenase